MRTFIKTVIAPSMLGLVSMWLSLPAAAAPIGKDPRSLCLELDGRIRTSQGAIGTITECEFRFGNSGASAELRTLWNTFIALRSGYVIPQAIDRYYVHSIKPSGDKSIWSPGNPYKEYCEDDLHVSYTEATEIGLDFARGYCVFEDGSIMSAYALLTESGNEENWGLNHALKEIGLTLPGTRPTP